LGLETAAPVAPLQRLDTYYGLSQNLRERQSSPLSWVTPWT
jgi:hypothetical protein